MSIDFLGSKIMRGNEFPIIGTRVKGLNKKFDLSDPRSRSLYFRSKVGTQIDLIKKYLDNNTFIGYFVGKKNSGKGTYSGLLTEIFGKDKIELFSVGDMIRRVYENWKDFSKSERFEKLKSLYRGYISFDEAVDALLGRSTKKLLPTEFILAMVKLHISELPRKSILIDGLPRGMDQVSYSLYFRDVINYRDDPDFFILIDIPTAVISERIKHRVICPICHTSRNKKLLITSKIEQDKKSKGYYLVCDNPTCENVRMVPKEGDELGIEPIKARLQKDEETIKLILSLHGVPRILLRNSIPVSQAKVNFDGYELTPEYGFQMDHISGKVKVIEKPWTFKDDNDVLSHSLLAPPVVVSFIKQLPEVLGL
ncbi:hypothetical protein A2691_01505 [Candidatus Woesebacteria bacterium RIFCSPHIGHO2_01_FULL_39_23]|nr:MAG: hypothetical protein A2691_01505 [Candidatus Woesebacteria bacterium RIFCSPHIGHO2_01_FULL_39_23]